ncbi:hypothetical protein Tco_0078591 [Tanacetum coccineum]
MGHPEKEDQGYVDSGCSRHMTWNMSYLSNFKEFDGGYVTFGGGAKGRKITSKETLKTSKLDFEDVYFVKELQFNLFSVSQMCDKKNSILLKVPRKNNMYSVDMKNIVPKECLTCLVAKATLDESMLWHRRLGTLKTSKLDFEDVYFVKELKFNLFSVSQMCDKKNSVLFTDTGCFVLSLDFKLADESQVLLKVPRRNHMYNVDRRLIIPNES